MPFNINGTTITGGTSVTATDASSNKIYQQLSTGQVLNPVNSSNTVLTPMFNVGWSATGGWTVVSGIVPFSYTGGSGYYNVNSCYNTTTYAFTAPWTGLYLFKQHVYTYGNNATIGWYYHPLFYVNGSTSVRRPATPYRMRLYGMPASYAVDGDCCELIYLTAADYVQAGLAVNGTIEGYSTYSVFSGAYISN